MIRLPGLFVAATTAVALTGYVDSYDSAPAAATPTPEQQACLRAVTQETNNPDVVLGSSSFSQAGTEVIVLVGPQRAPWQCIAYSDGSTSRPMSLTNEGSL